MKQVKTYPLRMMCGSNVDLIADLPKGAGILSVSQRWVYHDAGGVHGRISVTQFYLVALVDPDAELEMRQFTAVLENTDTEDLSPDNYIGEVEYATEANRRGWTDEIIKYFVFEIKCNS